MTTLPLRSSLLVVGLTLASVQPAIAQLRPYPDRSTKDQLGRSMRSVVLIARAS